VAQNGHPALFFSPAYPFPLSQVLFPISKQAPKSKLIGPIIADKPYLNNFDLQIPVKFILKIGEVGGLKLINVDRKVIKH
jgi:hypothetical protein